MIDSSGKTQPRKSKYVPRVDKFASFFCTHKLGQRGVLCCDGCVCVVLCVGVQGVCVCVCDASKGVFVVWVTVCVGVFVFCFVVCVVLCCVVLHGV